MRWVAPSEIDDANHQLEKKLWDVVHELAHLLERKHWGPFRRVRHEDWDY